MVSNFHVSASRRFDGIAKSADGGSLKVILTKTASKNILR